MTPSTQIRNRIAIPALVIWLSVGAMGSASARDLTVDLAGATEVPRVETRASGHGTLQLSDDGHITGRVHTQGIIDGLSAQIHEGAPNERGAVLISLQYLDGETWIVPPGARFGADDLASLAAGKLYINVHSRAHMDGEIRGQLKAASVTAQRTGSMH